MKVEVLLSCMDQNDFSLVQKSKITGDILIVNQTIINSLTSNTNGNQQIRMISTTERGLSRSRNMAIENSQGDICLFCDDDEVFRTNYEEIIENAFRTIPDADIIAFDVENKETRLGQGLQKIGYLNTLKIASYQIAFRRDAIKKSNIRFDVFMGAGSGNGCSEENKFLWDCLRKGLKIYYCSDTIATLYETKSTWFFGYDKNFFYQRGAATCYMMGTLPAVIYGGYYLLRKKSMYTPTISMNSACKELLRGIIENPIQKQINQNKKGV